MKPPLPPFIESVRRLAEEALDDLAGEVFDLDAVRGAIIDAAKTGFQSVVIRPPRAVDLRSTAAAKAAEKHLADSGFKVFWESYVVESAGRRLTGMELHISWPT
jgi:hypothetical protein